MKHPIAYVDIRYSVHATENPEIVKKAVYHLFSEEEQEITFRKTALKGYYGNPIDLFEAKIKDKKIIEGLIHNLSTHLNPMDKNTILREADLYIDKSNLYLRLDKQALLEDTFILRRNGPIRLSLHFKTHKPTRNDIIEICRQLGLVL